MSYDEIMAHKWPAAPSVRADVNHGRLPFHLARRSQVAREWHDDPLVKSQVAAFIDTKPNEPVSQLRKATNSVYAPLNRANEIRVFELLPAGVDQPILGSLHHVFVDCSVEHGGRPTDFAVSVPEEALVCYTALSYVWGDPTKDCKIEIDKKPIDITSSLDIALRHLRHEKDAIMVWVDQVCIDQEDIAEQSAQIRLMFLIYSRALNTVIWLGPTPAQDAFDALYDLENTTTSRYGQMPDEIRATVFKPGGYEAIETLFNAPWFQRTWTTQEACLSNEPWVMAGRSICHWEDSFGSAAVNEKIGLFHPTPTLTQSPASPRLPGHDVPPLRLHGFQCAIAIWEIKHESKSSRSLLNALVKTRHTQATEPEDNLYGILGLFENDIDPADKQEATELWRSMSVQILKTRVNDDGEQILSNEVRPAQAFCLLSCVDHGVDESGDLPSWAVDWSKSRVTTSLAYSTSAVSCFNAGRSSAAGNDFQLDEQEGILGLKAKLFDTIAHLSPILEAADLEAAVSDEDNKALRTCIAHATSVTPGSSVEVSFVGFCKVITARKDGSGRQKYPADYTEVLSFLSDELTGESPTFRDQPYTPRQQNKSRGKLTVDSLKTRGMGRTFQDLREAFKSAVLNRRLCWTKEGHLGLVPRFAQKDDCVIVVPGSPVPFVVRRVGKGDRRYQFIGECYVDGIMDGEAMADRERGLRDLDLV